MIIKALDNRWENLEDRWDNWGLSSLNNNTRITHKGMEIILQTTIAFKTTPPTLSTSKIMVTLKNILISIIGVLIKKKAKMRGLAMSNSGIRSNPINHHRENQREKRKK